MIAAKSGRASRLAGKFERTKFMGHGDHWRCIFSDLENGIADALGWVSQGTVLGQREYSSLAVPGGEAGATVSVIAWPAEGLHANFVVVREKQGGRAYLHTAFPAVGAGCPYQIRIDSVHEASCGLEARISGVLGDAAVTFFDPLYSLNRDRYSAGALVDVDLAGVAYSLKVVPRGTKLKTAVGEVAMDGVTVVFGRKVALRNKLFLFSSLRSQEWRLRVETTKLADLSDRGGPHDPMVLEFLFLPACPLRIRRSASRVQMRWDCEAAAVRHAARRRR
jgi:hypothetical protein